MLASQQVAWRCATLKRPRENPVLSMLAQAHIALWLICRAASLLCCGHDEMHRELCTRIVCELVLNEDFYLQPSIIPVMDPVGSEVIKNGLPATSSSYNAAASLATNQLNIDLARIVLHMDCLQATKNGEYSKMWHIHGLASVLQKRLLSIYPEQKSDHIFTRVSFLA